MTTPSEKESNSKSAESKSISALTDPLLGVLLADRYEILEQIGAGGWGSVYKAKHATLDLYFAVKIVHRHHLRDEDGLKRFEQEAQLMSRLDNPHIIKIVDHGLLPVPFIVMEYVQGISLTDWLHKHGAMPAPIAIDLFLQLSDALSAAEAIRIVHRDLKPSNILIKANTEPMQCKILDFGLAKLVDTTDNAERITATGEVLGSPAYMSPEQWKGKSDNRSDIYSFGCIMYEVLAGKPPYSSSNGLEYLHKHLTETPASISFVNPKQEHPAGLEDIIRKCMQKSPVDRYQSIGACKADLIKIREGLRPAVFLPDRERDKRKKILLIVSSTFLLLITAAYLMREPLVHCLNTQLYAQANAKLEAGKNDSAIEQYRQIVFLSQFLPAKDSQQLPALRAVIDDLTRRKEFEAAEQLWKTRLSPIVGGVSPAKRTHLSVYADRNTKNFIRRAKVRVATEIEKRGWNNEVAASFLGIDPATVSAIVHDQPADLSLDQMTQLLLELHLNMAFPVPLPEDEMQTMLAYFERAIKFDKNNTQAYIEHAGVYRQMNRYDEAIKDLTAAHKLDPNDTGTILSRADMYLMNGQGDLALLDLNQMLKQNPLDGSLYWRRAKYWYQKKEYNKALSDEDLAIRQQNYPRCEPYADRAAIKEALGRLPEAILDWQKCLEIDPGYKTIPINIRQVGNIQTHISELKEKH